MDQLTEREREVMGLLKEGLSNAQIAKRLKISMHTAKFHLENALWKLDAKNRTHGAVIFALAEQRAAS